MQTYSVNLDSNTLRATFCQSSNDCSSLKAEAIPWCEFSFALSSHPGTFCSACSIATSGQSTQPSPQHAGCNKEKQILSNRVLLSILSCTKELRHCLGKDDNKVRRNQWHCISLQPLQHLIQSQQISTPVCIYTSLLWNNICALNYILVNRTAPNTFLQA